MSCSINEKITTNTFTEFFRILRNCEVLLICSTHVYGTTPMSRNFDQGTCFGSLYGSYATGDLKLLTIQRVRVLWITLNVQKNKNFSPQKLPVIRIVP